MKKLIIMAVSLALVAGFAMTAAAADWNFYGSSRMAQFFTNTETIDGPGDVDNFEMNLQGNSRIGANVKVSDELSGRFEYGTSVNLRILIGKWNFGGGSLTVGQTYSPLNMFVSDQVYGSDTGLLNVGGVYSGREPMLQLAFGGFKVALVELDNADDVSFSNNDGYSFDDNAGVTHDVAATTNTGAVENTMPAIEMSYAYSQDNWNVKAAGGYQSYERHFGGVEIDVDSYIVALSGGVNFGALYIKGSVYTGENAGNLIALNTSGSGWDGGGLAGGKTNAAGVLIDTDDNDIIGAVIVIGGKINDMFSVQAGYSFAEQERDSWTEEDEVSSYYLQSTITFAPGIFVVPEIGMIDGEESGQTEFTYFGAKWQINF